MLLTKTLCTYCSTCWQTYTTPIQLITGISKLKKRCSVCRIVANLLGLLIKLRLKYLLVSRSLEEREPKLLQTDVIYSCIYKSRPGKHKRLFQGSKLPTSITVFATNYCLSKGKHKSYLPLILRDQLDGSHLQGLLSPL